MNKLFLILMALIAFLSLYFTPNTGYDPLLKEYNIWLWGVVAVVIISAAVKSVINRNLVLPKYYIWFLLLPLGLTAGTIVNGVPYPKDLLFRIGYVLSGVLFFISIYQFDLGRRTKENAVYIFVFATLLFSVVSVLQAIPGQILLGWIPHMTTPRIIGVFQQANVNVSAVLTGVLLSLFIMTTPGFSKRNAVLKLICVLTIMLGMAVVVSSGSRIGLLAAVLALPVLFLSRAKVLYRNKTTAAGAILALVVGVGVGMQDLTVLTKDIKLTEKGGGVPESMQLAALPDRIGMYASGGGGSTAFDRTLWKIQRLFQGEGDVRPHVYSVAFDVMSDKPFYGHGIGTFQSVFHERAAEYMAARDGKPLIGPNRYGHPHNELLLWGVEGGAIALLAILAVAVVIMTALFNLGWQRGGAMFALLVPIAVHTQVELPFYSSVYHWLLFIFIVYLTLSYKRPCAVRCEKTAVVMPVVFGMGVWSVLLVYFCITTIPVSRDINHFFMYKQLDMKKLEAAGDNLYFGEFATMLRLKVLLNQDLRNRTNHWTKEFIEWSEMYVKKEPETSTIHAIALAYRNLGLNRNALETLNRGLYLYPGNKKLSQLYHQILIGK
ncbi:PglL family O-oligosaccharyltransferase [Marinobacterium iners]|uniref:O-antigen ligase n=1 Tax=Marinobacterium iners DSM 11526 TaxID=1122198 RepID=A0A1H3Y9D6_9GAMM|nr:Wzy polymerase domain-containing protein [Marinobacterium iners]SEA08216.1 O-antigen ligase [Marinobacterium iners DSM 11526]